MKRLGPRFFQRGTFDVARSMLGSKLVRVLDGKRLAGRIVEVEAYLGAEDPASHAYRGMTARNKVMFGEPGCAYLYFTMGMHWCLNVTTERAGKAGAVLIRAIEPMEGVRQMLRRRGGRPLEELGNGPAKLTEAMGIDGRMNGENLNLSRRLFLEVGPRARNVETSPRVGINMGVEHQWRFFVSGNRFVSKGSPSTGHRTHN